MTTGNQDAAAILTALKDELAAMAAAEHKGNENSNGPTVSMTRRAALYEGFAARLDEAIRQIAGGPADAMADSAAAKPVLQIGDPAPAGDDAHAGFIYAGIPPGGGEPLWVSKYPGGLKTHFGAAAWSASKDGSLPTRAQADYLDGIKDKGALHAMFSRNSLFPDGYVWLADPVEGLENHVWCHKLSNGEQGIINTHPHTELSVLCVRG